MGPGSTGDIEKNEKIVFAIDLGTQDNPPEVREGEEKQVLILS